MSSSNLLIELAVREYLGRQHWVLMDLQHGEDVLLSKDKPLTFEEGTLLYYNFEEQGPTIEARLGSKRYFGKTTAYLSQMLQRHQPDHATRVGVQGTVIKEIWIPTPREF